MPFNGRPEPTQDYLNCRCGKGDCKTCVTYLTELMDWHRTRTRTVNLSQRTPSRSVTRVVTKRQSPAPRPPCRHEGAVIEFCQGCWGEAAHVRDCELHELCVRGPVRSSKARICLNCSDYSRIDEPPAPMPAPTPVPETSVMKWSYGITTVPKRRDSLLPRTLASLKAAGFDRPHLFVDGCDDSRSWHDEFELPVTARGTPNVRTAGNWVLSLYELFYRDPSADYYAVFQDDLLTCANLRRYLEVNPCPQPGYMNLYTFPKNQVLAPRSPHGGTIDGWFPTQVVARATEEGGGEIEFQTGYGAVGLVFPRDGVMDLLGSRELSGRPVSPKRGHMAIDGGVVHCMNKAGYVEYCHSPSLVQHTGLHSSMGNKQHPQAESFRGEKFDLLSLLPT